MHIARDGGLMKESIVQFGHMWTQEGKEGLVVLVRQPVRSGVFVGWEGFYGRRQFFHGDGGVQFLQVSIPKSGQSDPLEILGHTVD